MQDFLDSKQLLFLSHVHLLMLILQDCTTDDPIIQLYQYEDYLQSGIGLASFFLAKVNEVGIDEINYSCGAELTPLIEGISPINNNLELLFDALRYVCFKETL